MGFFENDDGGRAFTVVNCEDLKRGQTASARIRTSAPVAVWQNGERHDAEPDSEGYIEINLDCGEGAFVEIIK